MIQDYGTNEVRIRNDQHFIAAPNNLLAGEAMQAGVFVQIGAQNRYYTVGHTERASHLIIRNGQVDADDPLSIAEGELVLAISGGPGRVMIPFASDMVEGQKLTTNADGYAVGWDSGTSGTAAHIIGEALEDVTVDAETGLGWGEAFISLPSSVISTTTTSESAHG